MIPEETALDFLRRCDTKDEVISTGRLTELQIAKEPSCEHDDSFGG